MCFWLSGAEITILMFSNGPDILVIEYVILQLNIYHIFVLLTLF